jgi:hypothetical protein
MGGKKGVRKKYVVNCFWYLFVVKLGCNGWNKKKLKKKTNYFQILQNGKKKHTIHKSIFFC